MSNTNQIQLKTGQLVYDPRGRVEAEPQSLAERLSTLDGLRLGVLDNSKWNGGKLLRRTVARLAESTTFAEIHTYTKESFSRNASPEMIAQIVAENDFVITAIGD